MPETARGSHVRKGPLDERADAAYRTGGAGLAAYAPLTALRKLETGPRGLTEQEAEERLARYGENAPPAWRTPSPVRRLTHGARDPFTGVLLCLALVSTAVGSLGTAAVIAALVAVSCALRAGGELRADRSVADLRSLVAGTVTVLRRRDADAARPGAREIPVGDLVPGDVIALGPGDLVPADVLLLRSTGLVVQQAPLTGESRPLPKRRAGAWAGPGAAGLRPAGDTALFEQPHICFVGSSVVAGGGTAVVVATGAGTRLAAGQEHARPACGTFDRSVRSVAWTLVRCMLLVPPLAFAADAVVGGHGVAILPFAVAVAVSLTPEMLPVVRTVVLARSAAALAHERRVIVRRLSALHDLGAMDVLCLDKTGTLTEDRPVVDRALGPDGSGDPAVLHWAALNALWTLQLAENPVPDALDEAVLDAVADGPGPRMSPTKRGPGTGRSAAVDFEAYEGVAAVPFDPARRLSVAVVRDPRRTGVHTLVVKGAVDAVLERCALTDEDRAVLGARAARYAADGLRLLAVATAERHAPVGAAGAGGAADARGLTFVGTVLLRDTPAEGAREALRVLRAQGVGVKILTGDHPGTAARTCRALGLDPNPAVPGAGCPASATDRAESAGGGDKGNTGAAEVGTGATAGSPRVPAGHAGAATGNSGTGDLTGAAAAGEDGSDTGAVPASAGADGGVAGDHGDRVLTADRIDALCDDALAEAAERATLFAECTPHHKARVVAALRAAGRTTGFLGDGLNDVAALRAADVALCPREAVATVRQSADVVFAERPFAALEDTLAAGRRSGASLTAYLRVTLSSNAGNALAMLAAALLFPFVPMLPAQVLVQNLFFDAAQLAFAFDHRAGTPAGPTALRPRRMLRFALVFGALNAAADLATFAVLAATVPGAAGEAGQALFHAGWFTENLLTQAMVMVLLRTGTAPRWPRGRWPGFRGPVMASALLLAATGIVLPLTALGAALGMVPALTPLSYALLALVLAGYGAVLTVAMRRYARHARP